MKKFSKYIITKIFIHVLVLVGSFILMNTRFGFTSSGDVIKVACGGGTIDILENIQEEFEKRTNKKLEIVPVGPILGTWELYNKRVNAGFFSLPFDVLLQLLEEEGMIIDNPDVFNYIILGQASTKVIVNQDNMVSRLSKEDLKRIFLGIEKNWKSFGWEDVPIEVVIAKQMKGIHTIFSQKILDGFPINPKNRIDVEYPDDILEEVEKRKGAIGLAIADPKEYKVKVVESPEIKREIIFLTVGQMGSDIKILLDLLSKAK